MYRVSKKIPILWKNGHNYLQTHPKKLGVFWKIQDICYQIGTEIFKIEEEMTEKMKPAPISRNVRSSVSQSVSQLVNKLKTMLRKAKLLK